MGRGRRTRIWCERVTVPRTVIPTEIARYAPNSSFPLPRLCQNFLSGYKMGDATK